MFASKLISHLVLLLCLKYASGANILCLMGIPSPSHHIWNRALMEAVARNEKNNLTIVSCDVERKSPPNMHYIHLEKMYSNIYNESSEPMDLIEMAKGGPLSELMDYYKFGLLSAEGMFKSKGLAQILSYPKSFKFDLVLHDFTMGPYMLGILQHFDHQPPVISVSAFSIPPFTSAVIGGHKYPAYIPYYSLAYSTSMNFWQRCWNTAIYICDAVYRKYIYMPRLETMMRENYKRPDIDAEAIEQNTALMLLNSHPAVDFPEPLPPNIILVGGLQIKAPKPLPADLEQFVRAAKKGAVLVSLGTNIRSDQLDQNRLKMFLAAMECLPDYNFVWKFESDTLPPQPKNVMIRAWLPQNDILGHPNTKAFVTHSGLLSTTEASWHGIPMVGIPFIADQHRNLFKSMENGVALKVDFHTMASETLRVALDRILNDPRYNTKAKLVAQRFRDQPEKPIDRAAWWVEWVMRNPNVDHLKSPALPMGWFKSNLYDIQLCGALLIGLAVNYVRKLFCSQQARPTSSTSKKHQ